MILQSHIPYDVSPRDLPGISPFDPAAWLDVDDAYAAQMAERIRLLETREDEVLQCAPEALPPAREVLDMVCENLAAHHAGFCVGAGGVTTPDGRTVTRDAARPLHMLAHLIQEDICILQKQGDEHILTGALLCFPASWRLDEKFMRPLSHIHHTVDAYDTGIEKRVQRLFDGVQAGRPLWRFNALRYADAALFQPRSIHDRRDQPKTGEEKFMRSERQCILRLPQSNAVVFSIHTYVVAV
ncbi:DUF3445 domain-containing protein [Primorskyibacter aestuariivivens]|uniref:heme-dependent oxidative N-demethylase family protein n=1 Tax=Primorskyibacter aestuariivivens TaxID=1888912 RepID=UPI0022FFF778|nr:DUF3445 domain-containing protein [Primorskyibacter aestuariivivens]MDA7427018.1 DUF3445 domain-containing protein [Primorskyibacter aestuariivivens]